MKDVYCSRKRREKRKRIIISEIVCIVAILMVFISLFIINITKSSKETELTKNNDNITVVEVGYVDNATTSTTEVTAKPKVTLTKKEMLDYINNNSLLYGEALCEIANNNEELIDYVYNYLEESKKKHEIRIGLDLYSNKMPLFIQWDKRWGYLPYGNGLIGYTGCGPTCLSMVAIYLTGKAEYTPDVVAGYAENNGYSVYGEGTSWTLMSEGCGEFGLVAEEVCLDKNSMIAHLAEGRPIICAMGPGTFTSDGHFIVLTGYSNDKFTVNDPNSPVKSARSFSYEEICDQIRNMWAYSKQK